MNNNIKLNVVLIIASLVIIVQAVPLVASVIKTKSLGGALLSTSTSNYTYTSPTYIRPSYITSSSGSMFCDELASDIADAQVVLDTILKGTSGLTDAQISTFTTNLTQALIAYATVCSAASR